MTEDRKREIIYATLELVAENGLGKVSMQQIADKVGIRKASLYNHFSSKDEIIETMYEVLRRASKEKSAVSIDYDELTDGRSLEEILSIAVGSYRRMIRDPQMFLFYRIIMSERTISPTASEIMVKETKTMIEATKNLFLLLRRKGIADFGDVDQAAFSFAMAVHSIIDYELDLAQSGMEADDGMIEGHIGEFCRIYGTKGE